MSEWKIPSPFLVRLRNVWSHGDMRKMRKQLLQRYHGTLLDGSDCDACQSAYDMQDKGEKQPNITPKKAFMSSASP